MNNSCAPARKAIICIASILLVLMGAELVVRIKHNSLFAWHDLNRPKSLKPLDGDPPEMIDAELGWIPRPGRYYRLSGWVATIGEDHLRMNSAERPEGRPILAVGDSLTYGDEVVGIGKSMTAGKRLLRYSYSDLRPMPRHGAPR